MKISIRVPSCLTHFDERGMTDRANLTGQAKQSFRYGNRLASIEVVATVDVQPHQSDRRV